jgi:hypothetical protein
MKIGTSYDVYLQRNRWPAAARDLGLDAEALVERARELARIAPDAFADAVSAPDVVALRRELPGRLLDLVAGRARRCLELLSDHG